MKRGEMARGFCPVCDKEVAITSKGAYRHTYEGKRCKGTGRDVIWKKVASDLYVKRSG